MTEDVIPAKAGIALLRVPYDSGHRAARMGAGPDVLGDAIAASLGASIVSDETIEAPNGFHTEASTGVALARTLSTRVQHAVAAGHRPLVLAGNCLSSLGTVSGLQAAGPDDDVAVLWLDAHGDLETPDTTASGFVDGMALAVLAGWCWPALVASVPGFRPIPPERIVLVGARDLSLAERTAIDATGITWLSVDSLGTGDPPLAAALDRLRAAGARRIYLHVDLDVHDPSVGSVNGYQPPNGLSGATVRTIVREVGESLDIAALALTAYDPSGDPDRKIVDVATRLVSLIAE